MTATAFTIEKYEEKYEERRKKFNETALKRRESRRGLISKWSNWVGSWFGLRWESSFEKWSRHYDLAREDEHQAWTKFHTLPMYKQVVAKGCVLQVGKYPTFRGRIRVDPPLGTENAETLLRLQILEGSWNRLRLDMAKVAVELGLSLEEAVEKYGPEGEFLDYQRREELGISEEKTDELTVVPGQGVSPMSPPPRALNFQYWEEDAVTGKVLLGYHMDLKDAEKSTPVSSGSNVVAFLAWNFSEKTDYFIEWLAYLGEVILKPIGRKLNGELECRDFDTSWKIRVTNSCVSIPEPLVYDDWYCDDRTCPGCEKWSKKLGPLDWVVPEISADAFSPESQPHKDPHTLKKERSLFEELSKPCTWQRAAGEWLCCGDGIVPYAHSVLLQLPSAPPVDKCVCTTEERENNEIVEPPIEKQKVEQQKEEEESSKKDTDDCEETGNKK